MESKVTYELKGQKRKELVQAIAELLGKKATYKGVPTFAYEIGDIVVDREGSVIINDSMTPAELDSMVKKLKAHGFLPTSYEENAFDGIEVSMPREMFSDKALENLHKIVNAKGELIANAIGSMDLRIIENDEMVRFPWFPKTEEGEEVKHYTQFIAALCDMAIERKRVVSTPRKSENEKYDFRCFLLRLGFIGDKYKGLRKLLMRNLTGNAAFKNGKPKN